MRLTDIWCDVLDGVDYEESLSLRGIEFDVLAVQGTNICHRRLYINITINYYNDLEIKKIA